MSVMSGRYRHPQNGGYSEKLKGLIDSCLVVDPEQRPNINKVSGKSDVLSSFGKSERLELMGC